MKKFASVWILLLCSAAASLAIVPPRTQDVKIPSYMLRNIKSNPAFYMPEKGLKSKIIQFREQKRAVQSSKKAAAPYEPPFVHAHLPVLCVQYSDVEQEWKTETLQSKLFGNWKTGSMRDYYHEVSYGQFDLTGQVHGWFQVSGNSEYYYDDSGHTGLLLRELFQISDDSVDYGQYDDDGPDGIPNSGDDDGYVDVMIIVHSGGGAEEGGRGIWSHSFVYSAYFGQAYSTQDVSVNGGFIKIDEYTIQPAIEKGKMVEIGVFCHEFGHSLGLPDLYDRDDEEDGETSEGVGNWCLMAGGSWGGDGNSAQYPSHMSAWCKEVLGWLDPIVVQQNTLDAFFPAVEDTPVVYKLWTNGNIEPYQYNSGGNLGLSADIGKQYFLVENRRQKGFDQTIEGSGLLIWHVDNTVGYNQNDDENHKLVDLEEADGRRDLDYGRNGGDDKDPFPGSTVNRFFNRITNPNSLDYQDRVTKIAVNNISDSADSMYADLYSNARDIGYVEYTLNDGGGNGNGYLDPGEYGQIAITVNNFGADLHTVTAVLSTDDPTIAITDSTAIYSFMAEDAETTTGADGFGIEALPDAHYHPVNCRLRLEDELGVITTLNVIIMMENIYILVVDDSWNETDENNIPVITFYQSALDELNITYYDTWRVAQKGSPDIDQLNKYGTVVWFTGSQANTLSAAEQNTIQTFLQSGGELFLTGQNIGDDLIGSGNAASRLFYENILHARHIEDTATSSPIVMVAGIDGDPISKTFRPYFFITEGNGANNNTSASIVAPDTLASPLLNYFGTGLMDKAAAIKYRGDDYRLVYFAFSFEGVNEFGTKNITRKQMMGNVINWLQGTENPVSGIRDENLPVAGQYVLYQNYPNPFNPQTSIDFYVPKATHATVKVYDIMGRELVTLFDNEIKAGNHQVVWQGRDSMGNNVASGIYFYRLQAGDFGQIHKMLLVR
ncbi:MAG TPA: M6 family metalloprotease domain-containing protein [bacterium]|nr:M6 family metalloprotease domain-containing protein [bacterium]HPN45170.1 M6 family metalloprotease domain-containing protein [bacterium]